MERISMYSAKAILSLRGDGGEKVPFKHSKNSTMALRTIHLRVERRVDSGLAHDEEQKLEEESSPKRLSPSVGLLHGPTLRDLRRNGREKWLKQKQGPALARHRQSRVRFLLFAEQADRARSQWRPPLPANRRSVWCRCCLDRTQPSGV
jgi:hypothetical protein